MKPENAAKATEPNMVLAMASCTKLMTVIAVLQCVERDLFDLDEDVAQVLPELRNLEIAPKAEGLNDSPTLNRLKIAIIPG